MVYRCEAASAAGFVQQLACSYLSNGYHYYVVGEIPERKDPRAVDAAMLERYGPELSRFQRARRKRAGHANVQYLRFRRFFVLLATGPRGAHPFYDEHSPAQVRHIREQPITFSGYSIGYHRGVDRKWHVSVRIHPDRSRTLRAFLLEQAVRRSEGELALAFAKLPFEPYAPVRRQFLAMLRAVNEVRSRVGLERLDVAVLRLRRRIVRPFVEEGPGVTTERREDGTTTRTMGTRSALLREEWRAAADRWGVPLLPSPA